MASWLDRFMGKKELSSAEIAKERLKLVLVSDRSDLPQDKLEEMQAEIIAVIKRYIEIDELQVQIKLEQRQRKNYLVADIPLHRDRSYQIASEMAPPPSGTPDPADPADKPAGTASADTAPGADTRPRKPGVLDDADTSDT